MVAKILEVVAGLTEAVVSLKSEPSGLLRISINLYLGREYHALVDPHYSRKVWTAIERLSAVRL